MAVMGEKETVIWAVLLIANDEEIANLKPGVAVTILATPTKDGSKRVELVQSAGPECSATCAGLTNLIVNR
jgi:hypothetical protein